MKIFSSTCLTQICDFPDWVRNDSTLQFVVEDYLGLDVQTMTLSQRKNIQHHLFQLNLLHKDQVYFEIALPQVQNENNDNVASWSRFFKELVEFKERNKVAGFVFVFGDCVKLSHSFYDAKEDILEPSAKIIMKPTLAMLKNILTGEHWQLFNWTMTCEHIVLPGCGYWKYKKIILLQGAVNSLQPGSNTSLKEMRQLLDKLMQHMAPDDHHKFLFEQTTYATQFDCCPNDDEDQTIIAIKNVERSECEAFLKTGMLDAMKENNLDEEYYSNCYGGYTWDSARLIERKLNYFCESSLSLAGVYCTNFQYDLHSNHRESVLQCALRCRDLIQMEHQLLFEDAKEHFEEEYEHEPVATSSPKQLATATISDGENSIQKATSNTNPGGNDLIFEMDSWEVCLGAVDVDIAGNI